MPIKNLITNALFCLSPEDIHHFQQWVYHYYDQFGRSLPWRDTTDPYAILISEIMLQQTQVSRVIPKYHKWLTTYPNFNSLSLAKPAQVLQLWSGLGYNRRALNLHNLSIVVTLRHQGSLKHFEHWTPTKASKLDPLTALPGIGPYTACAVRAFAWNQAVTMIETNIRTVYFYHFTSHQNKVKISDTQLIPLITATLDSKQPRRWYNALFDYGAYLKTIQPGLNHKSKHYHGQSSFIGSSRQARGQIVSILSQQEKEIHIDRLYQLISASLPNLSFELFNQALWSLEKDKLIIFHHESKTVFVP